MPCISGRSDSPDFCPQNGQNTPPAFRALRNLGPLKGLRPQRAATPQLVRETYFENL